MGRAHCPRKRQQHFFIMRVSPKRRIGHEQMFMNQKRQGLGFLLVES